MLILPSLLASIGMTSWSEAVPENNRNIVIAYEEANTNMPNMRGSWKLHALHGFYTTWITGPDTEGCGLHKQSLLQVHPGADKNWTEQPVVLVYRKFEIAGGITQGVIPASLLKHSWWGYADHMVGLSEVQEKGEEVDKLRVSLTGFFGVEPDEIKTRIKHNGVFFPLRKKSK